MNRIELIKQLRSGGTPQAGGFSDKYSQIRQLRAQASSQKKEQEDQEKRKKSLEEMRAEYKSKLNEAKEYNRKAIMLDAFSPKNLKEAGKTVFNKIGSFLDEAGKTQSKAMDERLQYGATSSRGFSAQDQSKVGFMDELKAKPTALARYGAETVSNLTSLATMGKYAPFQEFSKPKNVAEAQAMSSIEMADLFMAPTKATKLTKIQDNFITKARKFITKPNNAQRLTAEEISNLENIAKKTTKTEQDFLEVSELYDKVKSRNELLKLKQKDDFAKNNMELIRKQENAPKRNLDDIGSETFDTSKENIANVKFTDKLDKSNKSAIIKETNKTKMADNLDPKKYKTADEFVKAQNKDIKIGSIDDFRNKKADVALRLQDGYSDKNYLTFEKREIVLTWIASEKKGTGIGSKIVNDLKKYADATGRPLEITNVSNEKFWNKFDFFKKSAGDYRYEPESQLKDIWNKANGKEEALGVVGGFEQDENGNITFNPKKAAIGVAGMAGIKRVGKIDYSKLPKQYQGIAKTKGGTKKSFNELVKKVGKGIDKIGGSISTRLKNINPELKKAIRRFEYNLNTNTLKDTNNALPFLKSTRQMSKQDLAIFDLAAKNSDIKVMKQLAENYGFTKELKQVRKTLDDLYSRAKEVGADIGYKKNYFPRTVKDSNAFLDYLGKGKDWNIIQEALENHAQTLGKKITDLEIEEKAQIINNLLRGYGDPISLSKIQNFKNRNIDTVNNELNQFYESFESSLVNYITNANDYIESRKFFGKHIKNDVDVEDSIASYVMRAMADGQIKPSQEKELSDILKARFNKKKINSAIKVYKNLEYIDTMGNPISAITQIGDLAFSAYKSGYFRTGGSLLKAVFKRSKFTKEDLGMERIAQEFVDGSKTGKAVDKIFKLTGLNAIDRLGKETLINSSYKKYRSMAKRKDSKLQKQLLEIFNRDEAKQVVNDLKTGKKTDNVKMLLFNDLLDVQPVALSEMPEKYLSAPNGRIFYMLKTYQLKVLDIYRREIFSDMKKHPLRATKNLIKLASALMVFNITADKIKDFVLGRETDFNDTMVDNILRTAGFSKYDVWKAREEGIATALKKKILPPSKIFDSIYKDIISEDKKSETTASIPLVGKLYYWWFGRGAEKTKKSGTTPTARKREIPKTTPNIKRRKIRSSMDN